MARQFWNARSRLPNGEFVRRTFAVTKSICTDQGHKRFITASEFDTRKQETLQAAEMWMQQVAYGRIDG